MPDAVARPRGRGWPRMLRLMDWSRLAAARPAPVAAQGGQAGASGPGGQPRGGGLTPRQRCGIRRRTPPPRQRDVAAPPPRWPGSQIGATRRQGMAGSGGPAHDGTGRARQLFRGVAAAPLPRRRCSSSSSLRWWASRWHGPVLLEPSCRMAPGWDARSSQPVKLDPIRSAR